MIDLCDTHISGAQHDVLHTCPARDDPTRPHFRRDYRFIFDAIPDYLEQ